MELYELQHCKLQRGRVVQKFNLKIDGSPELNVPEASHSRPNYKDPDVTEELPRLGNLLGKLGKIFGGPKVYELGRSQNVSVTNSYRRMLGFLKISSLFV